MLLLCLIQSEQAALEHPLPVWQGESLSVSPLLLLLHAATAQYVPDGRHSWRQWASFTNISICVKRRENILKPLARSRGVYLFGFRFFATNIKMFASQLLLQFCRHLRIKSGKWHVKCDDLCGAWEFPLTSPNNNFKILNCHSHRSLTLFIVAWDDGEEKFTTQLCVFRSKKWKKERERMEFLWIWNFRVNLMIWFWWDSSEAIARQEPWSCFFRCRWSADLTQHFNTGYTLLFCWQRQRKAGGTEMTVDHTV